MVYCAAYGCNNEAKKGSGISFFRFPSDVQVRKAWTHFCRRWNFLPGPNHRLCSRHFSKQCYTKDPDLMLQLGISYKPVLLPDAKPDVPIPDADAGKDGGRLTIPRGAFEKRRKAEILQMAFDGHTRAATPELPDEPADTGADIPTSELPDPDIPVEVAIPASVQSKTPIRMVNKKLQVQLQPSRRTRCNQTDTKVTLGIQTKQYQTTATQTEMSHTDVADPPDYSSDSDDDTTEQQSGDESVYNPTDDDSSFSSDGDDSDTEFLDMNYKLDRKAKPDEEKQFLVSESALAELLSICRYCCGEAVPIIQHTRGTMIVTNSVCVNGHMSIWKSQSSHNNLPWSNLMLATAILCSGSNSSKVLQMFQHFNVQMMSSRTYNRLQTLYTSPSATMTWDSEQSSLLADLHNNEVIVGGDARCDSPGYSAKYGSYTMMDLQTSKILDFQLVQCNEVKGSAHMELEGLKRSIRYLEDTMHLKIKDLVTDRHSSIKKFMRTEQASTNHLFDVWHVAKGISKKLEAAAKKSGSKDIRPWIKSIVNHIYWISSSCGTDGDLKSAKWLSIVNHVCNIHQHQSSLYPQCEHAPITVERQWLKEGTVPYKRLKEVVENKYLMKDVPKLSPVYQTYALEVFHSVVNHFCPKSTHFFYPAMLARLSIAALHYNENSSRQQATTKSGEQRFSMSYPKAKKGTEAVVKPRKTPPTFDYVMLIKQAVVERRNSECPTYSSAADDLLVTNNHHPAHTTTTFTPYSKADLIQRHRSRFQRQ